MTLASRAFIFALNDSVRKRDPALISYALFISSAISSYISGSRTLLHFFPIAFLPFHLTLK